MDVFLRAFNIPDGEKIYLWLLEKKNQSHTCGDTFFASKDYVQKWIEGKIFNTKDIYLAICLSETQEMIGYLSIKDIDHRNRKAVLGGILIGNDEYCGKGIALESLRLAMVFAFEELNINLLTTYMLEEQPASIKLVEKLGFIKIGLLPQAVFKDGKYHNQLFYYILKDEYDMKKLQK
jgi:RimJ/RimL family protein N-acetyltransferase